MLRCKLLTLGPHGKMALLQCLSRPRYMNVIYAFLVVGVLFRASHASESDERCRSSQDCQYLGANSECRKTFSACEFGECTCKYGYMYENGKKCLTKKAYNETCSEPTDICSWDQQCMEVGGQYRCLCQSSPYHEKTERCVAKILGDTCSSNDDCSSIGVFAVCATSKDSDVKTCGCAPGLVRKDQYCSEPTLGDECLPGTTCMGLRIDNTTSLPVCKDGECVCPPHHDRYIMKHEGGEAGVCYKNEGRYDKELEAPCKQSSECQSRLCGACVLGDQSVCQDAVVIAGVSGGMALSSSLVLMFSAIYLGLYSV